MFDKFPRKQKALSAPKIPPSSDLWAFRVVVATLSVTLMGCVAGAIWLQTHNKQTPELLTALGTASAGALAVVLRPPSKS